MNESKLTFFRQSGWLVIATGICGVFLIGVYPLLRPPRMPPAELGIFAALLRLFTILGLATAGLQIVMAQDAAAAVTAERRKALAASARSVARGIIVLWAVIALFCLLFQGRIAGVLKISNPAALWVTLALVLAQMFLPFSQGLLQGSQNFAWLGWSIMSNGFGRFAGMFVAIVVLHTVATGALTAALFGLLLAVAVALWPSRTLLWGERAPFDWIAWFKRVLPLTGGIAATQFLMLADVLFVQSHVSEQDAPYYSAVAMVGVGLVTFTTPMAAVMFPKLVRSAAQAQKTNSLQLALAGTAVLGVAGAVFCTIFPDLPLRVLYANSPQYLASAQLIPWFMWAMLPVTVANVLISNLLAKQKFKAVPWLVAVAVGYGIALGTYLNGAQGLERFAIFKGVILRLGIFSVLLLLVSALFSVIQRETALTGRES